MAYDTDKRDYEFQIPELELRQVESETLSLETPGILLPGFGNGCSYISSKKGRKREGPAPSVRLTSADELRQDLPKVNSGSDNSGFKSGPLS